MMIFDLRSSTSTMSKLELGATRTSRHMAAILVLASSVAAIRIPSLSFHRLRGGDGDGYTSFHRLRGGDGDGIDIDAMLALAQSPEAAEELRRLQEDPEAMRAAREMMDDPEFRAQMMEALGKGDNRGEKFAELQKSLSGDTDLGSTIKELGPSLGAALDILKRGTEAAEFDEACKTLDGICRRLADKGSEDARYRRLRLSNDMLQAKLLKFPGAERCLNALGFVNELEIEGEAHLEHNGRGLEVLEAPGSASPSLHGGPFGRSLDVIAKAREEVIKASLIHKEHGVNYRIALELPTIR